MIWRTLSHFKIIAGPRAARLVFLGLIYALALFGCGQKAGPPVATSLVEAFPLAELWTETLDIDIGELEARHHLLEGWSGDERRGDVTFVWGLGDLSALSLVIMDPRPLELVVACWHPAFPDAPDQIVGVSLNGHAIGELRLDRERERSEYRIPLPAASQIRGDNRLELRYAYHRRPVDVIPGSRDPRSLAVAWDLVRVLGAGSGGTPQAHSRGGPGELVLPFRTAIDFYALLPEGGRLEIDGIVPWGELTSWPQSEAGPVLRVKLASSGVSGEEIFELPVSGKSAAAGSVPLPPSPHGPTRITMEPELGDLVLQPGGESGLRLINPVLHHAPPDLPETRRPRSADAGHRPHSDERPNVLIYLVDTLRADHLGSYGYAEPTSPNIDAFAREATLFSSALTHTSWTRPAVASLFTGLEPRVHGTNAKDDGLSESLPVLPEILADLGYDTAAFVGNGNVSQGVGFARGFQYFDWQPSEREGSELLGHPSDEITDAAFRWLDRRTGDSPLLLYLHTVDPHLPYDGLLPFTGDTAPAAGEQEKIGRVEFMDGLRRGITEASPQLATDLIRLYDRDIAFNDAQFGRLMSKLKSLGLYDSTLIVFLSDHGEEFLEHNGWTHGATLFQEQLLVPLIIKFPQGFAKGRRVTSTTGQIDILPTILDLLGAPVPPRVQGRSLLPGIAAGGTENDSPPTYAYLELDGQLLESVTFEGKKLIHHMGDWLGRREFELYDLSVDPKELTNLAEREPIWAGYLHSLLKLRHEESGPRIVAPKASVDDDLRRSLLALGYIE